MFGNSWKYNLFHMRGQKEKRRNCLHNCHKDNTVSSFSFLRSLCLIGTLVGPSLYYLCTHAHMRTPDLRKHSLQSPCLLPPTAPKPRGN